ncbi:oxidoreductase [Nocardia sp. NPDC052278]|uniref:oxidoreductase n=1 Tax=unclassified Nocardia TaxID=2637762 RepID=UPI0036BDD668
MTRIFVVGDCAAVPNARFACATATPQGAHAATTLARLISGQMPKRYSMGYVGQALSLGRRDGLIQASRRDDAPLNFHNSGRLAAFSKEWINRYAKYGSRTANYAWLPGAASR